MNEVILIFAHNATLRTLALRLVVRSRHSPACPPAFLSPSAFVWETFYRTYGML